MATERESPDVLLDQTNLSGAVTAIQDDPDAPDGNWLDAVSNNADSICRTSFPTPTGNPTVGADLQEFRVLVRKLGGTGTPTARVELYENGVLIRAGSENNVTGNLVISFTWNANEIGTANGSLVECRLYGTKSGGAPTARAAIEVGAVEWNVVYSVSVTVTPGTASLATTRYTPTLTISDNKIVTPGTLSSVTTRYTPLVILNTIVTPGTLALVTTRYTPTVTIGGSAVVIPGIASLTATKYTPSIILGTVVTPGIGSLTTNRYTPLVILGKVIVPGVGGITTTRYTPTVTATLNVTVTPNTLALILTRFAPSVGVGKIVTPGTLALLLTAYAPTSYLWMRRLQIDTDVSVSQDLNFSPTISVLYNISKTLKAPLAITSTIKEK